MAGLEEMLRSRSRRAREEFEELLARTGLEGSLTIEEGEEVMALEDRRVEGVSLEGEETATLAIQAYGEEGSQRQDTGRRSAEFFGSTGGKGKGTSVKTFEDQEQEVLAMEEGNKRSEARGASESVENQWTGGPLGQPRSLGPLFDEEQLKRLEELQRNAPMLYTSRSEARVLEEARPKFLKEEEERTMRLQLLEEERKRREVAEENRRLREIVMNTEKILEENARLKKKIEEGVGSPEKFNTPEERRSGEAGRGGDPSPDTLQVMMTMLKGMQEMQKQFFEKDKEERGEEGWKGMEYVKGHPELPKLPTWSPTTGPIDLNDWMALLEPIMSDLTASSHEWWTQLVKETRAWYTAHMEMAPLDRLQHEPKPSEVLEKKKWMRLEKRVSTMLLMSIPDAQREELVSAKKLSVMQIVGHLYTTFQPGGIAEKEVILKALEMPPEPSSLGEAVAELRKWVRWKRRAMDIQVNEPDPFILLKGLGRIVRKSLEANKELNFRVSLARSMLKVDSAPTKQTVDQFATHLLAELEQVAHLDGSKRNLPKEAGKGGSDPKIKKFEREGSEVKGTGKKGEGKEKGGLPCRFFNTEGGCKKGRECSWLHHVEGEAKRCWNCGGVDHYANQCTRPKEAKEREGGKGKGKTEGKTIQKVMHEKEEESSPPRSETLSREAGTEAGTEAESTMKGLLEEANRMLKTLHQGKEEVRKEPAEREGRLERLQKQLDDLKSLRVFRVAKVEEGGAEGLIDSGATHPLRGRLEKETLKGTQEVKVTLACGREATLRMNEAGTMISTAEGTEPIVPMGKMVTHLRCQLGWSEKGLVVTHPTRGELPIREVGGCPHIPKGLALELIKEIEDKERKARRMEVKEEEKEREWLVRMVEEHPILNRLPSEVKSSLIVTPAQDLVELPETNRRSRRKINKGGGVLHLYAGPKEGFTLKEAMKKEGGDATTLIEVDKIRGRGQDMLRDQPYAAMVRMAMDGALDGVIMGPNCRTRSVLRHYRVSSEEHGPRPLRRWGGEEFGLVDLNDEEKKKVMEDDILLWRGLFLYVISVHVRRSLEEKKRDVILAVEQPATPEYVPETVSLWKTDEWLRMEKAYGLHTQTFNQGDWIGELGGGVVKPTTMGGNLKLEVPREKNPEAKGRSAGKEDSKKLARWVPGLMRAVARSLIKHVHPEKSLKAFSWEEHVQNGHIPFHRECVVCQQAGAKSAPHRRIVGGRKGGKPKSGVLSLDTSGPFVKGIDLGEEKMKFILVGTFTWLVAKGSKLKEGGEEEECPEEAPQIEEEVKEDPKPEDEEGKSKPKRGRPRKPRPEDDEIEDDDEAWRDLGGEKQEEEELFREAEEKDGAVDEEEMKDFEVRTFRMVVPIESKRGEVVLQGIVEMVHQLRLDGFEITQVHSDNGGEFKATCVRRWLNNRGYIQTFTGVNEPQSNGRAENAVQQVKNQMRRLLLQANLGSEWWPIAARHTNAQLHALRIGKKQDFPPLNMEVLTKKRDWKSKEFAPTMEKVRYLCPSWQNHGHWVVREDGTRIVTRFYISKVFNPVTDQSWIAFSDEHPNPIEVRRRIRGKTAVRMLIPEDEKGEEEGSEEEIEKMRKPRVMKMISEEMMMMMEDNSEEQLRATMRGVVMLRSVVETGPGEDVLQTRIVGINEVMESLEDWKKPVMEELTSLVKDKEALQVIPKGEAREMFRKAFEEGRKVEVVPGKLVTTVKPGAAGGRKKARIVACGNFTSKDSQEELYAGTGDAVTLRYLLKRAVEEGWEGMTVDVKAAFLNTPWDDSDVLVKPPGILTRMNLIEEGTLWRPTKALYGFRKSPRLWGHHRDGILRKKEIMMEGRTYVLRQLVAEPNLWKIEEKEEDEEKMEVQGKRLYGLMMVYVDDIFATAEKELLKKVIEAVQEEWETSTPLFVSSEPVRFLGMEIVKEKDEDTGEIRWGATQENYVKELLKKTYGGDEAKWPKKKIPMTKEVPTEVQEEVKLEEIRRAQKAMGEVLWLVTRTRPDLMFTVAKLSSYVLRNPAWVLESVQQLHGYLAVTISEGVFYTKGEEKEGWEEDSGLEVYADASFSPGGQESHGAVVVMYHGGLLLWRSSRQATVTLSTAEAELNEMIEGLMVGESVAAIIEEVNPSLVKMMVSDSQSAINICLSEGGSWRTRHLRLRAAHAKQRFVKGDWILRHCPGLLMLADIGTKTLPSARLEDLRRKLGMRKMVKSEEEKLVEEEEEERGDREGEDLEGKAKIEDRKDQQGAQRLTEEVEKALKVVILMALVQGAKGQKDQEENGTWLQVIIVIFAVIGVIETLRKIWRSMRRLGAQGEPEEEPVDSQEGQRARDEERRVEGQRTQNEERRVEGQRTQNEERRVGGQRTQSEERREEGQRMREEVRSEGSRQQPDGEGRGTPVRQRDGSVQEMRSPGESMRLSREITPRDQTPGRRSSNSSRQYPGSVASSGYSRNPGSAASSSYFQNSRSAMPIPPMPILRGSMHNSPASSQNFPEPIHQIPPEPEGESPNQVRRRVRNRVVITRWGQKYHTRSSCPTLANSHRIVFSPWCARCSNEETDLLSPRLFATGGNGETVHYSSNCGGLTRGYEKCQVCEAGGR